MIPCKLGNIPRLCVMLLILYSEVRSTVHCKQKAAISKTMAAYNNM